MDRSNTPYSAPTINSVRDSQGEVGEALSTYDTTVTLEGKAGGHERVEILDMAEILSTVPAIDDHWAATLPSLAFKTYSIKARGILGSPESGVRTFSVIYRGEDFETEESGVIPANTALKLPTMFVTPNKNASVIDDSTAAPFVTMKAISFADDSSVRFDLKSPVNKITFGAFAKASSSDVEMPYLACFDERDELIFQRDLVFGPGDYAAWQDVVSPDRRIKALVITVSPGTDWLYVDNFTFA